MHIYMQPCHKLFVFLSAVKLLINTFQNICVIEIVTSRHNLNVYMYNVHIQQLYLSIIYVKFKYNSIRHFHGFREADFKLFDMYITKLVEQYPTNISTKLQALFLLYLMNYLPCPWP